MNILVVCAHPDDETIGMGGTLKKLTKNHNVSVLFVSEGITARRKSGYVTIPQYDVSHDEMKKMQDRSHRYCFIANSLSEEVKIIIN